MLKILGGVLGGGAKAPETSKDDRAARVASSEERAEAIIAAMAAKKAGVVVKAPAEPAKAAPAVKVAAETIPETTPETETDDTRAADIETAAAGLDGMDGVFYEILGLFVWAWGDTKPHKEELKALGYRWSSDKKKWYWRPATYFKKSKRKWNFDEIEETFRDRRRAA